MEGLKIIIADDEALIRLDLREMLTEAGHTVLGEASLPPQSARHLLTMCQSVLTARDPRSPHPK